MLFTGIFNGWSLSGCFTSLEQSWAIIFCRFPKHAIQDLWRAWPPLSVQILLHILPSSHIRFESVKKISQCVFYFSSFRFLSANQFFLFFISQKSNDRISPWSTMLYGSKNCYRLQKGLITRRIKYFNRNQIRPCFEHIWRWLSSSLVVFTLDILISYFQSWKESPH